MHSDEEHYLQLDHSPHLLPKRSMRQSHSFGLSTRRIGIYMLSEGNKVVSSSAIFGLTCAVLRSEQDNVSEGLS